jgi:hypothetical protein
MEKKFVWLIMGIIIIFLIIINLVLFRGDEDNWILDSKGVYIKHGNPRDIPSYVKVQQDALTCANTLYTNAKNSGMVFNSQCLGKCGDYSVDVVHVPRSSEDNIIENQCSDYSLGVTHKFIELDKDGNIVKVSE